jgi:hypothetical protein
MMTNTLIDPEGIGNHRMNSVDPLVENVKLDEKDNKNIMYKP